MERFFGEDLSQVRLHREASARAATTEQGAKARAIDEHIAFGFTAPEPLSADGDALLVHELAHVLQQRRGARAGTSATAATASDAGEAEAARAAATFRGAAPGASRPHWSVTQAAPAGAAQLEIDPALGLRGPQPRFHALDAFPTNQSTLTAGHLRTIAAVAAELTAEPLGPSDFVTITGSTDAVGPETTNQELGQRRADAVLDELASLVPAEAVTKLRAYSLGESVQVEETGRPSARNRRVEITIHRGRALFQLPAPALWRSATRTGFEPPPARTRGALPLRPGAVPFEPEVMRRTREALEKEQPTERSAAPFDPRLQAILERRYRRPIEGLDDAVELILNEPLSAAAGVLSQITGEDPRKLGRELAEAATTAMKEALVRQALEAFGISESARTNSPWPDEKDLEEERVETPPI